MAEIVAQARQLDAEDVLVCDVQLGLLRLRTRVTRGKKRECGLGCGSSSSSQSHIGQSLPRKAAGKQRRVSHLQRLYKLSRQIACATDEKEGRGGGETIEKKKGSERKSDRYITLHTHTHSGH